MQLDYNKIFINTEIEVSFFNNRHYLFSFFSNFEIKKSHKTMRLSLIKQ